MEFVPSSATGALLAEEFPATTGKILVVQAQETSGDVVRILHDRNMDVDEIYCISVNDAFVMNAWAKHQKIQNVKVIPDGSGNFTRFMGMLVGKNHVGFGMRSWRYMCVINDGIVEQWWQEPGINNDGSDSDPYGQTTPENMMDYLDTDEISID